MKKTVLILITLLIGLAAYSQNLTCTNYINGDFYYPDLPGKLSVRNKNIQKSYNDGKLEMIWKVKWISECEFELTCKKILSKDKNYPIKKGDRIITMMIPISENCYDTDIVFFSKQFPDGQGMPSGIMCKK